MSHKRTLQFLQDSMFEDIDMIGDNIRIYGYSPTHGEKVHIASLKVNVPSHMQSVISSNDVKDELETLVNTQILARQTMINKGVLRC